MEIWHKNLKCDCILIFYSIVDKILIMTAWKICQDTFKYAIGSTSTMTKHFIYIIQTGPNQQKTTKKNKKRNRTKITPYKLNHSLWGFQGSIRVLVAIVEIWSPLAPLEEICTWCNHCREGNSYVITCRQTPGDDKNYVSNEPMALTFHLNIW